ncbi:MAG TPA: MFS transporter [Thermoguttaceae bacterium]|nr:MFS transporter [Thermoguttaceae bacterium]
MRARAILCNLTPSRRRWFILGIVFGALVLNYFDRQIVSVLSVDLKKEFGVGDRGYAMILNVFLVCYAISYPIGGWLVDRFGPRIMMLLAIITWSTACIGTGLSRAMGPFLFFRGMLGIAEPTAYPAQLRAVAAWFPGTLRATANSFCQAGSSIGAIAAPPLVVFLASNFDWHTAFIVPGIVGFGVAVCWWLIYREPPAEIVEETLPSAPAEAAFTWPQLWRTRTLWGFLLWRFVSDPVWYFCLFWLPGYLRESSGLSLGQIGKIAWIPFLAADLGAMVTSACSDGLVRRGIEPLRARKLMLTAAACFAPLCAVIPYLGNTAAVLTVFSFVAIMCLTWLFNLGVVVAETFPAANIGGVVGIAAGCGAAGGIVFNAIVGEASERFGMAPMFAVMAVLHPLATILLWTMIRRERPPQKTATATNHLDAPTNL